MGRIVLAYSGGPEATVAIPWLADRYDLEVVTLTVDLGEDRELAHVRERALAAGAVRAHVLDSREEFLRDYVLPTLWSGGFSPDRQFAGIGIADALIATRLVEVARMEAAALVAHGFGPEDADRVQAFEAVLRAADPAITIVAPVHVWKMSAEDIIEYARRRSISLPAARRTADANIWGRLVTTHDASKQYTLTRDLDETPDAAAFIEIEFAAGVPVRANGIDMPLIEMIESIETIAGTHGVGRLPGPNGAAAESPAAIVLHAAHQELSRAGAGPAASGTVRLRLFKGRCEVAPAPEPVG